jgi:hypothetical protein
VDKQLWAGVAVVVLGYVIGFTFQRRDIDKLETSLNRRIDDLHSEMVARIADLRTEMVARFEGLRDLLRSEIRRLEERIDRLEHPVARA